MWPLKLRRSLSMAIPIFSALAFFGLIESMFQVGITENLMKTGITIGLILGIANIVLIYLVYKHQVP